MNFSIVRQNSSWKTVIILSILFYLHQSYAVTFQDLSPEDIQWYNDQVTHTHKVLDEQAKEDIEEGLGNKKNNNNYTNKKDKKTKDSKKEVRLRLPQ
ncbi:MAG: hypothetical protein QS748_02880 [Candidatus Endonucleobacter bathymodioli]|uniref:Uncharacterized protein n=1 Tax=Candidatus Endonucleibacter bathymodioli TaxID=539814 RepID=A0AA90NK81_9GAMM|nr:hypothetical protein [Candidatus Endonucleobacter bathymodioli]